MSALYRGQLIVTQTFCKNGWSHSQILIKKPVCSAKFIANKSIQRKQYLSAYRTFRSKSICEQQVINKSFHLLIIFHLLKNKYISLKISFRGYNVITKNKARSLNCWYMNKKHKQYLCILFKTDILVYPFQSRSSKQNHLSMVHQNKKLKKC